jgi:two-component SAPR family response regulator
MNIVVAILSSVAMDKRFFDDENLNVHDYLQKPVNPERLVELVKYAGLSG